MRGLLRPSLLLVGTAAALVGGGSVLAFAGWTSRTVSPTFTIHATRVPQVQKPTVTLIKAALERGEAAVFEEAPGTPVNPNAKIQWTKVELTPDEAVHRYIITRHAGAIATIVCTLPATKTPVCIDKTAPAGNTLTYTVAASYGMNWVGEESEPSPAVTMPGTPVVVSASSPPVEPSAADTPPAVAASASSTPEVSVGAVDPSVLPTITTTEPSSTPSLAPSTNSPVVPPTTEPTVTEPASAATEAQPATVG